MAISITRLSGGNTPADGSDPRTFPAIWNATAATLEANVGTGGGSITVSDTAPTDPAPANGDLWWKSDDGKLFVYYVDGDSSQWVDAAGPSVAVQSSAPTGYEGQLWLDDTDGSMYVYYTDPGGGSSSWIGAVSRSGGILQVVSTTKTDTFSTTSTSYVDVTGLSVSVTPRSTSSKVLVTGHIQLNQRNSNTNGVYQITRNGTPIAIGDAAGSRKRVTGSYRPGDSNSNGGMTQLAFEYLDSPSTTSTVTYQIQIVSNTGTLAVNTAADDADNSTNSRAVSTITASEVAG
jgi:hypothetical protein